jgi:hypothetical protein
MKDRDFIGPAPARAASAKATMSASGVVIVVLRRNNCGGNRSTVPRTMPAVSVVSMRPSTEMRRS